MPDNASGDERLDVGVVAYQLERFRAMLAALREHLAQTDPALIPLLEEGYLQRIAQLEAELRAQRLLAMGCEQ